MCAPVAATRPRTTYLTDRAFGFASTKVPRFVRLPNPESSLRSRSLGILPPLPVTLFASTMSESTTHIAQPSDTDPADHVQTSNPRSFVEVVGWHSGRCGYCGKPSSSRLFGVWCLRIHVNDYQSMLDAGWRRSGYYLYRPDLQSACCQHFVIRLDANEFQPTKGHRRVLRRLRKACEPKSTPTNHVVHEPLQQTQAEPHCERTHEGGPHEIAESMRTTGVQTVSTSQQDLKHNPQWRSDLDHACAVLQNTVFQHLLSMTSDENGREQNGERSSTAHPPLTLSRQVIDSAMPSIHVRLRSGPRDSARGSIAQSANANSRESSTPQPDQAKHVGENTPNDERPSFQSAQTIELTTNAALVVAAAERKHIASTQADTAKHMGTKKRKRSPPDIQRQMLIGDTLCTLLQKRSNEFGFDSVECAKPGFLNFVLRKDSISTLFGQKQVQLDSSCLKPCTVLETDAAVGKRRSAFATTTADVDTDVVMREDKFVEPHVSRTRAAATLAPDLDEHQDIDVDSNRHAGNVREDSKPGSANTGVDLTPTPEGRRFHMEMRPSQFEQDEFDIYKRYQMTTHGDTARDCRESSYRRFLVDSPLVATRVCDGMSKKDATAHTTPPQGYGSFHLRYSLDGKLFAVGVVDVLPTCLSSVYLFYDPDFAALSPGVLSAIKEIEWVQSISCTVRDLRYYYMGYYIHTCPKMRYKAGFHPSRILCETTKQWILASEATAALNTASQRIVRLAPPDMEMAPAAAEHDISDHELHVLLNDAVALLDPKTLASVPYVLAVRNTDDNFDIGEACSDIRAFIRLVGRSTSRNFVHVLQQ